MNKIIGTTYNTTNLRAIDLETKTSVNLGSRKYVVISEPYKKAFEKPRNEFLCMFPGMWTIEQVWINVLDPATNRTYAVLFMPARVKGTPSVKDAPEAPKSADFIQRSGEIAEELKALADADPHFKETCGIVFFVMKKNPDGQTLTESSFVGGNKRNLITAIVSACNHGDGDCDVLIDILEAATHQAISDKAQRLIKNKRKTINNKHF